jgi:transcriptional regulator with XRE-family HTH domain
MADMKTKTPRPFPSVDRQLKTFGQRLREARLRRDISTVLFCERMNVSRDTLNRLEKGDASIAIGTYLRALRVLGLDKDFDTVAKNDELGRKLQDAKLLVRTPRGRAAKLLGIAADAKEAKSAVDIPDTADATAPGKSFDE